MLVTNFLLVSLHWLLLGNLANSLVLLVFIQTLHAVTFGSSHTAVTHFVRRNFDPCQQGQSQILYIALADIDGALDALYSSYGRNSLGPVWTFAVTSLAVLLTAAIISTHLQGVRA